MPGVHENARNAVDEKGRRERKGNNRGRDLQSILLILGTKMNKEEMEPTEKKGKS